MNGSEGSAVNPAADCNSTKKKQTKQLKNITKETAKILSLAHGQPTTVDAKLTLLLFAPIGILTYISSRFSRSPKGSFRQYDSLGLSRIVP